MLASTFFLIVGLIAGGVITAGGAAIIIPIVTRDKRARKRLFKEYMPNKVNDLPKEIDAELSGLRSDLERLLVLGEHKTAGFLANVISLAQELFSKIKNRGDTHQLNLAVVSYGDVLSKLNKALSDEYFFDMLEKPEHWDRVEERRTMVRDTVRAIEKELTEAIRNYNSFTDMTFEVDLETILRKNNAQGVLKDLGF